MKRALVLFPVACAMGGFGQWSVVGGGVVNGQIHTMLYIEDSSTLVIGGTSRYLNALAAPVNGIAYYKGGAWHPCRSGVTHSVPGGQVPQVTALLGHNGSLLAAGAFYAMDSIPMTSFAARWDGLTWHSMGIDSCCQEPALLRNWRHLDDKAHLCGWFDWNVDTQSIRSWATWSGAQWAPGDSDGLFPDGYSGSRQVNQVLDYNDQRYVGGNFQAWNVPKDLAVLNGDTWEEVGAGVQGDAWVNDLEVFDGKLWVAGEFYSGAGNPSTGLMTWDGTQWADPFPQIEHIAAGKELLVADGKLYVVGPFVAQGLDGQYRIAQFDGEQLCVVGGHLIQAYSIAASADTLYGFVYPEGWPMQQVAMWPMDAPADTCYTIVQGVSDAHVTTPRLALFPNPASDDITVRSDLDLSSDDVVRIVDATGRLERAIPVRSPGRTVTLPILDLAPGCYQIVVRTERFGRTISLPFIKVD